MRIFLHWLLAAIAIIIAAYILPGITITGFFVALVVALVLGFLNTFIKPILVLLSLPIEIITFGLFTFVINALLVLLTSAIVPGFHVNGFWWALLFSLIVSLVTTMFNHFSHQE